MIGLLTPLRTTSKRTMIEAALLELLEPLSVRQGRYLALLDQYNGEIGGGASEQDVRNALRGLVPAVLLQTGSAAYVADSMKRNRTVATLQIEILIASAHLRSHEARNIGDEASTGDASADPGAYQIMADVVDLIVGRDLAIDGVSVVRPISEIVTMQAPTLTAWVVRCEVDYRHEAAPVAAIGGPYTEIHHRGNLENSAAVNPVAEGVSTNG